MQIKEANWMTLWLALLFDPVTRVSDTFLLHQIPFKHTTCVGFLGQQNRGLRGSYTTQ